MIKLIENAYEHKERISVISDGQSYSYRQLLQRSESIALELLNGGNHLNEERIAFLINPGFNYVCIQWAIWRAGGIAVPLCEKHPLTSIAYVLDDTKASILVFDPQYAEFLKPLQKDRNIRFISSEDFSPGSGNLPSIDSSQRAMILYTSGTTGNPKGVVTTHDNIERQITSLTTSWEWEEDDHILNVLPLHHVHGIVNVLSCALWTGACCEFLPKFSPSHVFDVFLKGEVNLFMAVPTIYYKLIAYYNEQDPDRKYGISEALKKFRLMVSGSAALPISVLKQWEQISGHTLLERYGMTEMGMAISNSYNGERKPGYIGLPLNGVRIRIADEKDQKVKQGTQGEIQVKGANIFKEYWGKPEATKSTFSVDGWFKTGDIAIFENEAYRILGRNSVDIIKSGGYKISALEIEEVLRKHPFIKECGVVGLPDDEWGEIIGASLITDGQQIDVKELRDWLIDKLASYKLPRKYIFQDDLPRNVMGKVTKNELKKLF